MPVVVEKRRIRRPASAPPITLASVGAGNCTNPENKKLFVADAMRDYRITSRSVQGILKLMGEMR
jgi:hypothetical protein